MPWAVPLMPSSRSSLGNASFVSARPVAGDGKINPGELQHSHQLADAQALVRDRASQFIDAFDEIFRTEGCKILTTPVRTPVANASAERWIGTLRRELLNRTIIWNQRQLNKLVVDYIDHYNTHTGPTAHSTSDHPSPPTLQTSQIDTSKSLERPAATDSSTNTNMPPDQPRHDFRHPQGRTRCC